MGCRDKALQLEGYEREAARAALQRRIESGELSEEEATDQLTAFASADSVAREQAMLVAQLKSGQLGEEEAHTARQQLAQMDHERKTQAEKLDSSGKTVDPVFNIASIEATSRLLLQKAEVLQERLLRPGLTDEERRLLQAELEELERSSEDALHHAYRVAKEHEQRNQMLLRQAEAAGRQAAQLKQAFDKAYRDPGVSDAAKEELEAELEQAQVAASSAQAATKSGRFSLAAFPGGSMHFHPSSHSVVQLQKKGAHELLTQVRTMAAVVSKAHRGKISAEEMRNKITASGKALQDVASGFQSASDMKTALFARQAQEELKPLLRGAYSEEEVAGMAPAQLRAALAEQAKLRQPETAEQETQTKETVAGVRTAAQALSKVVPWERAAPTAARGGALAHAVSEPVGKRRASGGQSQATPSPRRPRATSSAPAARVIDGDRSHYHSSALTNREGSLQATPHKPRDCKERIANIMAAKVRTDRKLDEAGVKRIALPDFAQAEFLNKFGLQTIATKQVHGFAAAIWANEEEEEPDALIRLFARLSGVLEPAAFASMDVNLVHDFLDLLFMSRLNVEAGGLKVLANALLGSLPVDRQLADDALATLLDAYRESPLLPAITADLDQCRLPDDALCALTGKVGGAGGAGTVPLLPLLQTLLLHWDANEEPRNAELVNIFHQFDSDMDQEISLDEFENLVRTKDLQVFLAESSEHTEEDFEWDRPPKVVRKMFKKALHESRLPEPEAISLPAFIAVAHMFKVVEDTTPWERKNAIVARAQMMADVRREAQSGACCCKRDCAVSVSRRQSAESGARA